MLSYCLKYKKIQKTKIARTENGIIMLLLKWSVCNSKNPEFIKGQEAKALLANLLGANIPISGDIPLVNTLS